MVNIPKSWPADCEHRARTFYPDFNEAIFESKFSRHEQVQRHGGGKSDRWVGIWTTPQLSGDLIAKGEAFIASLDGRKNTFYAYDPDRRAPNGTDLSSALYAGSTSEYAGASTSYAGAGTAAEIGTVDGADQTGRSLNTSWPVNSTLVLTAGDYFQIGNQLLMATADATTDGSGDVEIEFQPSLRLSPLNNQSIFTINPVMIARLDEPWKGAQTDAGKFGIISFSFHEVIDNG